MSSGAVLQYPRTRLVLAVSVDGRLAPAEGGAAQLGGRGDRRVLEEALAWSDAALLGAETLRQHRCTALIREPDLLLQRSGSGRSSQPVAVVASRGAAIDSDLPFFRQALERWLLAPPQHEARACELGFQRFVPMRGWVEALAQLAGLGIQRLAVLGGAAVAGALLSEQLVDELQITLCPWLLGGGNIWLPAWASLQNPGLCLLEQRVLGGGELLLRYGTTSSGASV
ncbi:MAG: dihydrofolate reductase family protein [Cyanobacteriota bacterium]|nr:dihydrofolate reductase family protein [Cyanobacteriota bacterium]